MAPQKQESTTDSKKKIDQKTTKSGIFDRFLRKNDVFSKKVAKRFGSNEKMRTFAIPNEKNGSPAEVAQLVEHNLAKVGVASSSLVFRSKKQVSRNADFRFENTT